MKKETANKVNEKMSILIEENSQWEKTHAESFAQQIQHYMESLVVENTEEGYVDSGWEANGNKLYFKGEIGY